MDDMPRWNPPAGGTRKERHPTKTTTSRPIREDRPLCRLPTIHIALAGYARFSQCQLILVQYTPLTGSFHRECSRSEHLRAAIGRKESPPSRWALWDPQLHCCAGMAPEA